MKKILPALFIALFCLLVASTSAQAAYDPVSVPNNPYGIHIVDISDLEDAASLVNSQGGDWGYITLVIQKGDRDTFKWQRVFDKMRRLHLIPIVRVATVPNGNIWEKPSQDEIDGWVGFFNSLNWVVKNRYIIIANEPNHAKEWGGIVNPEEYSDYLSIFSQKLKSASNDYFVMPAGFDASAPNSRQTMDEANFVRRMVQKNPNVFANIDGWASHSYPNPAFAGSDNGFGKGTVRTYQWELEFLRLLGINKNLPVFITETGWVHSKNETRSRNFDPVQIGPKFEAAFKNAWNDKRVIAVTPFILNYQDSLFDNFSWKKKDGSFYEFYYYVKNLPKTGGAPVKDDKGTIVSVVSPAIGGVGDAVYLMIFVKNDGQAIWTMGSMEIKTGDAQNWQFESVFPPTIEPGQIGIVFVKGTLPAATGSYHNYFEIVNEGRAVTDKYTFEITVIPIQISPVSLIDKIKNFLGDFLGK